MGIVQTETDYKPSLSPMTHLYPTIVVSLTILYFIHGVIVFIIVAITFVSHIIHNGQCDECKDHLSFILQSFGLNSSPIERIVDYVVDYGHGIVLHCQRILHLRWMHPSLQ